jgi:hypothetical protein
MKAFREANLIPAYQDLPASIKDKVNQIEELYDRTFVYLAANEGVESDVSDFDSYLERNIDAWQGLNDLARYIFERDKPSKDLEELGKQDIPAFIKATIDQMKELYDRTFVYMAARDRAELGISDFDSYLKRQIAAWRGLNNHPKADPPEEETKLKEKSQTIRSKGKAKDISDCDLIDYLGILTYLWLYWITWPSSRQKYWGPVGDKQDLIEAVERAQDRVLVKLALQIGIKTAKIGNRAKEKEKIDRIISEALPEIKEAYQAIMQDGGGWSSLKGGAENRQKAVLAWFIRNAPRLSYLKKVHLEDGHLYNEGGGQEKRNFEMRLLKKVIKETMNKELTYNKINVRVRRVKTKKPG